MFLPVRHQACGCERGCPLSVAQRPVQHGVVLVAREGHYRASVGLRGEFLVVCPLVCFYEVQRDVARDADFELVGFVIDVAAEIAFGAFVVFKIGRKVKGLGFHLDIADERKVEEFCFLRVQVFSVERPHSL